MPKIFYPASYILHVSSFESCGVFLEMKLMSELHFMSMFQKNQTPLISRGSLSKVFLSLYTSFSWTCWVKVNGGSRRPHMGWARAMAVAHLRVCAASFNHGLLVQNKLLGIVWYSSQFVPSNTPFGGKVMYPSESIAKIPWKVVYP